MLLRERWIFFGDVVPTFDPKALYVVGPVLPDCDRIAIDLFQVIVERPKAEHRTAHLSAGISILAVMAMVDPDTSPGGLPKTNNAEEWIFNVGLTIAVARKYLLSSNTTMGRY